jgi:hypothetical protein
MDAPRVGAAPAPAAAVPAVPATPLVFPFPVSTLTPAYILSLLEGVGEGTALARLAAVAEAMRGHKLDLQAQMAHATTMEAALAEAHQRLLMAKLASVARPTGADGSPAVAAGAAGVAGTGPAAAGAASRSPRSASLRNF